MARKRSFRPIKVGIVGVGRGGCGQLKELGKHRSQFALKAVYDVDADRCRKVAEEWGAQPFADWKGFLAEADVELVTIANRSTDHVPYAMDCLKSGRRVLVEKPLAVTHAGAKKLAACARRAGSQLYVHQNRRFERGFCSLQEILKSKVLGEVFDIKLKRGGYQRRDDWQTLKACGGGQGLNWGAHIVDHALALLDGEAYDLWTDVKRVAALGDAEDHFKAVFRGKKSGLLIDVEVTGGQAQPDYPYRVTGTRGSLVGDDKVFKLRYIDPKQRFNKAARASSATPDLVGGYRFGEEIRWVEETVETKPPERDIWDCLFDAVRKRRKFPITVEHAVEIVRVIDAAKKGTPFESPLRGV